jgi:hypothetical protein
MTSWLGSAPKCPNCATPLRPSLLLTESPFPCQACNRKLFLDKKYRMIVTGVCYLLGFIATVSYYGSDLLRQGRFHTLFTEVYVVFALSFVVGAVLVVPMNRIASRLLRPQIEDYDEYMKQPHYTAL